MYCKIIVSVFFILSQTAILFGQTFEFAYDDSGNRKSRNLVTEPLKSGTVNFPVLNPKDLELSKGLESVESKRIESKASIETEEGKINTLIYPNPTSGILKIEILNMPLGSKTEARLYDLSGNELIVRKNLELLSEITVSHLKVGIYILRVRVNEKLFDWKVIKE